MTDTYGASLLSQRIGLEIVPTTTGGRSTLWYHGPNRIFGRKSGSTWVLRSYRMTSFTHRCLIGVVCVSLAFSACNEPKKTRQRPTERNPRAGGRSIV